MTSTIDLDPSDPVPLASTCPNGRLRRGRTWVAGSTVAVTIAYFVVVASLWLDRPGLYMDETNFVDAALGGRFDHQSYVYQRVGGLPILIIPYAGTLKAAAYAPIFAIFGVSVATVRIPVIVLSAATLVVTYLMGRQLIGPWSAVLVVVVGTCPAFIFMSKVDWGPVAVAMFLAAVFLLSFFLYESTGRVRWLSAVLGSILLGVFDKQNFVWLVVAVSAGAAVVYRKRLWRHARERPWATVAAWALFGYCFLFELALVLPNLSASSGSSSLQDPFTHLVPAWRLFEGTVGYSEVITIFTGRPVSQPLWMEIQVTFSLLALGVLALRRQRGPLASGCRVPARAAVFFSIVFVVMLFEVAATRLAIGPHHVIELVPYPTLVLVCSVVAVVRSGPSFRATSMVIAVVGLGVILAAQAVSTSQFISLMRNPDRFSTGFSTMVYRDASFLDANVGGVDEVVSAGWGPGTPLFSLACPRDRPKYRDDLWTSLAQLNAATAPSEVKRTFGDRRILLVSVHGVQNLGLPHDLYANETLLASAYATAFPGRHPVRVLTTSAYDITYLGPGLFRPGERDCPR